MVGGKVGGVNVFGGGVPSMMVQESCWERLGSVATLPVRITISRGRPEIF